MHRSFFTNTRGNKRKLIRNNICPESDCKAGRILCYSETGFLNRDLTIKEPVFPLTLTSETLQFFGLPIPGFL